MSLTKADIIDSIFNRLDYSRPRAPSLLETTLEIIKATLESGENVLISGLGKFCVKEKTDAEAETRPLVMS